MYSIGKIEVCLIAWDFYQSVHLILYFYLQNSFTKNYQKKLVEKSKNMLT